MVYWAGNSPGYYPGEKEMAESVTHKRTKSKAAGKSGRTEVRVPGNQRIDAITRSQAVEVETSGQKARLEKAAQRLKDSGRNLLILVVPQTHMTKAKAAIKSAKTSATVRNLSGTKYSRVNVRKSSRGTASTKRKASARSKSSNRR